MSYLPRRRCTHCGLRIRYATDYYVLKNPVWNKAMTGRATGRNDRPCSGATGYLHIVCAEQRLGRELRQKDFEGVPLNFGAYGFDSRHFAA